MNFHWHSLVASFLFLGLASQNPATAQTNPVPPPLGPAATVYFTISGKHGAPLTPALPDLAASIDGHPVPIASLRPANAEKLLFALIVDTSGSSYDHRVAIKDAAIKIFEGLSSGGNQGYLVLFSWEPHMSPRPLQLAEVRDALDNIHYSGGSGLYDAIAQTCTKRLSRAANPSSPRRAIFVISDGVDNLGNVRNSNYPSVTFDQAEDAALREGVSIFSLMDLSGSIAGPDKKTQKLSERLSPDTGGRAVPVKQLAQGVAALLSAADQQWALDIKALPALDDRLHSLAIKTSQRDATIVAPIKTPLP